MAKGLAGHSLKTGKSNIVTASILDNKLPSSAGRAAFTIGDVDESTGENRCVVGGEAYDELGAFIGVISTDLRILSTTSATVYQHAAGILRSGVSVLVRVPDSFTPLVNGGLAVDGDGLFVNLSTVGAIKATNGFFESSETFTALDENGEEITAALATVIGGQVALGSLATNVATIGD